MFLPAGLGAGRYLMSRKGFGRDCGIVHAKSNFEFQ